MAWFRRDDNVEPTSLEQYYADQNRSTPRSWLFAIGAFLVTLILVFGIFWAGRWVYRKATHKDGSSQATTSPAGNPFSDATITTNTNKGSTKTQGVVNAPDNSSSKPSTAANGATSDAAKPTTNDQSTVAAGGANNAGSANISNTGPAGELLIFFAAAAAGTLLYQLKLRSDND